MIAQHGCGHRRTCPSHPRRRSLIRGDAPADRSAIRSSRIGQAPCWFRRGPSQRGLAMGKPANGGECAGSGDFVPIASHLKLRQSRSGITLSSARRTLQQPEVTWAREVPALIPISQDARRVGERLPRGGPQKRQREALAERPTPAWRCRSHRSDGAGRRPRAAGSWALRSGSRATTSRRHGWSTRGAIGGAAASSVTGPVSWSLSSATLAVKAGADCLLITCQGTTRGIRSCSTFWVHYGHDYHEAVVNV